MKIDRDTTRFRDIVRGRVRENLKKYINHGEMIGRKGRDLVSIPVPQLDIPHFEYGDNGSGGVGQGDGEEGQPIGRGQDGDQPGAAGNAPGGHVLEVELDLEELAEMMAHALELPNIEPKGDANLQEEKARYNSIRRTGPESLRHFKRTYKQALRRQISTGTYNFLRPRIVPIGDDKRYRSWSTHQEPQANAVIIYLMDVSGSMTDEQKSIVRTEAFWIDTWLKSQYEGVERRYIIHDAAAKEVDEHTFYHTRESGGTRISSAYQVACELIERSFPYSDWNIYCFQFSDGDNWGEDNKQSLSLLRERLLPVCNLFCYGQVESPYGSGEFIRSLHDEFGVEETRLILSEIENKEGIFASIKKFSGYWAITFHSGSHVMHERPLPNQRFAVRVGMRQVEIQCSSREEAIESARQQLCNELPRLWDVISSMEVHKFEVRKLG